MLAVLSWWQPRLRGKGFTLKCTKHLQWSAAVLVVIADWWWWLWVQSARWRRKCGRTEEDDDDDDNYDQQQDREAGKWWVTVSTGRKVTTTTAFISMARLEHSTSGYYGTIGVHNRDRLRKKLDTEGGTWTLAYFCYATKKSIFLLTEDVMKESGHSLFLWKKARNLYSRGCFYWQ